VPKKSLQDLKNDLQELQKLIATKEDKLKMELGAEVLNQTGVSSLKEFRMRYNIVKTDCKSENKMEVRK